MITNLLICSTTIGHLNCYQLFVFINKVALTLLKLSPSAYGQVCTVHNQCQCLPRYAQKWSTPIFKFTDDTLSIEKKAIILRSIHHWSQELQLVICKSNSLLSLFILLSQNKNNTPLKYFFLGVVLTLKIEKLFININIIHKCISQYCDYPQYFIYFQQMRE